MNNTLLKQPMRGKRAFSIVAGVLFCLWTLFDCISIVEELPYLFRNWRMTDMYVIYRVFTNVCLISSDVLLVVVCFMGRKNYLVIAAFGVEAFRWIVNFPLATYAFKQRDAILDWDINTVLYSLFVLTMLALVILCVIPPVARKCRWTRFIGYVPAVFYLLCTVSAMILWKMKIDSIYLAYFLFEFPAYLFFGLWLASSEKKQEINPPMQYDAYAPQYFAPEQQFGAYVPQNFAPQPTEQYPTPDMQYQSNYEN